MANTVCAVEPEPTQEAPRNGNLPKPKKTLTRKAGLNAAASMLDFAAKIGVSLLLTPLLVHGLGRTLFGVWQMLDRLVSVMSAADGRPTQALKWLIANQQLVEDDQAKRRHIASAVGAWLLFLPLLIILGGYLIWIAPFVTKVEPQDHLTVRITCGLLVTNFLLNGLIGLPEAVLRGMNLGYKRMGVVAGLNIVGGALTATAVYAGWGLVGVAASQIMLATLTAVLFWMVVKKSVRWFGLSRPSFVEVRSFMKLSMWWFAWTTTNKLLLSSDVVLLGFLASATAVTAYALNSYASLTILSVISLIMGAVTPGMGGLIGDRQHERALRLWGEMKAVSWLLVASAGTTILLWNRSFLELWVGKQHYAGMFPNLLIVLLMAQLVFIRNDAHVIDLTLDMRAKVTLGLISVVLSGLLCIALIPLLGIAGLCLALLLGRLLLTVSYPEIVRSSLGNAPREDWVLPLRAGATLITLYLGAAYLGQWQLASNWIVWLAGAGSSFGVAFAVALFAGLSPAHRRPLFRRFQMLRQRRHG